MTNRTTCPDSWYKSSYSRYCDSNCVEVATFPGDSIGARDSKVHDGPVLVSLRMAGPISYAW